jgi:hypothetical protein
MMKKTKTEVLYEILRELKIIFDLIFQYIH